MPTISVLTTIFGHLLCGLLMLPIIWFTINWCTSPPTLVNDLLIVLKEKEYREYIFSFSPLVLLIGYILGLIVDSLGHLVEHYTFEKLWNRSNSIPKSTRAEIKRLADLYNNDLSDDDLIQAAFYHNSSAHILAYRSEQWAYYEFFRNIFLISTIYFVFSVISWTACSQFGKSSLPWILISFLLAFTMTRIMKWTANYYYKVEAYAALGWLQKMHFDKHISAKGSTSPSSENL